MHNQRSASINRWVRFVMVKYMAKRFAKAFYHSQAWENCRANYIKQVGGLCERCLANGIYTAGVIVHHKTYLTPENITNPLYTTDFSNLELLCKDCHNKEHHYGKYYGKRKPKGRFIVGENGQIIAAD